MLLRTRLAIGMILHLAGGVGMGLLVSLDIPDRQLCIWVGTGLVAAYWAYSLSIAQHLSASRNVFDFNARLYGYMSLACGIGLGLVLSTTISHPWAGIGILLIIPGLLYASCALICHVGHRLLKRSDGGNRL